MTSITDNYGHFVFSNVRSSALFDIVPDGSGFMWFRHPNICNLFKVRLPFSMISIFLAVCLGITFLAVVKWNQGNDKPIEFDTPELKARREKFKKGVCRVTKEVKDFYTKADPTNPPSW